MLEELVKEVVEDFRVEDGSGNVFSSIYNIEVEEDWKDNYTVTGKVKVTHPARCFGSELIEDTFTEEANVLLRVSTEGIYPDVVLEEVIY